MCYGVAVAVAVVTAFQLHSLPPSVLPTGSVTFKRDWWNVFLLFLLWAFALSPITIKNRRVTHLCHVPECNAELEYFSSCSTLWCGDITVLHHRWKPNKMSHYSRFKATVGALYEWLSSVLIADVECWKSGVSALHPPVAADQTPFGFAQQQPFIPSPPSPILAQLKDTECMI